MEHTLLGYPIPFPPEDLLVGLAAVAAFVPTVIIVNFVGHSLLDAFGFCKKAKTA